MCISIVTLNLHMINFWGDLKTKFISKSLWLPPRVLAFVAACGLLLQTTSEPAYGKIKAGVFWSVAVALF